MNLLSIFSKKQPEVTSVADALSGSVQSQSKKSNKRHIDAENEQLIPEKKRARRRLIGAIVMVLTVVIGLPALLDSEPKPLNKHIVIQIPSKDLTTAPSGQHEQMMRDIVLDQASKAPLPPSVAEITPDSKIVPKTTLKSDISSSISAKLETKLETKADSVHPAEVLAKKEAPSRIKGTETVSADQHSNKVDETARALAILDGTAGASDVSAKAATRIVVQIGAFTTQEKVTELRGKLSSAGIKSYTQKVATNSGDKIRVRIGPFTDKESANKVKLQLEKLGLNGSLISL